MAGVLAFLAISALDFTAFVLALAAEISRNTAKAFADAEKNYSPCVYRLKIATVFGAVASIVLFVSQASRWFCYRKDQRPKGSGSCASIALTIICWATFLIAEACLIWGTVSSFQQTKYRFIFTSGNVNCHTLRKGVFQAAAAFTLITSLAFFPPLKDSTLPSKVENGENSLMLVNSSGEGNQEVDAKA